MRRVTGWFAALFLPVSTAAFAQANGKCSLQLHFMDVGQGDGAILISFERARRAQEGTEERPPHDQPRGDLGGYGVTV